MFYKFTVFLSLLTLFSGLNFPGLIAFPLEVNGSFPHLHFLADLLAISYFIRKKKLNWSLVSLIAIFIQGSNIFWPIFAPAQPRYLSGTQINVLYSNVYVNNKSADGLRRLIVSQQPELVLLTEVSEDWLKQLDISKDYPYSFLRPGRSADGNAIYSKFPLVEQKRISKDGYFAALSTKVEIASDKEIHINLVHAPPPQLDYTGQERLDFFANLSSQLAPEDKAQTFVVGDFNTASSNRLLVKIVNLFGLRLCANDWFDFPTWRPLELPILFAPIDHMLVGKDFEVLSFGAGPHIGSDHLPLLARLRIR